MMKCHVNTQVHHDQLYFMKLFKKKISKAKRHTFIKINIIAVIKHEIRAVLSHHLTFKYSKAL